MLGMLLPGAVAVAGALLALGVFTQEAGPTAKIAGAVLIVFATFLLIGLGFQLAVPRIGCVAGHVTFCARICSA